MRWPTRLLKRLPTLYMVQGMPTFFNCARCSQSSSLQIHSIQALLFHVQDLSITQDDNSLGCSWGCLLSCSHGCLHRCPDGSTTLYGSRVAYFFPLCTLFAEFKFTDTLNTSIAFLLSWFIIYSRWLLTRLLKKLPTPLPRQFYHCTWFKSSLLFQLCTLFTKFKLTSTKQSI